MKIQVIHASKKIQKVQILEDICLTLESGQIYGLHGANGSGKTMLMRLLTGVMRSTSGKILIDGKILGQEIDFPPKTGMLLERPAFIEEYTGWRNLKLLADLDGTEEKAINCSLVRVGLRPEDRRKYRKYSLGMKQKLGIAAAIMGEPDFILLDEPTNALDMKSYRCLEKILSQERKRGALILLASHDRRFLEEMSDLIFTMEEGRIVYKQKL